MTKEAGPSLKRPESVIIKSANAESVTQPTTIELGTPIQNRLMKAIAGIGLIYIARTFVFESLFQDDTCIMCFLISALGLSLIFQSLHRGRVSVSTGISYFIMAFCLPIIFIMVVLLLP